MNRPDRTGAKNKGLLFYYGKECNKCGTNKKYVSNYSCYECLKLSKEDNLYNEKQKEYKKKYDNSKKGKLKRKKWLENNSDKRKNHIKKYNNSDKRKIKMREYYINNKEKMKNRYLESKYGISLLKYNELLIEQNNKCKICEISLNESNKSFAVDHCHDTGKVRGLLCINCNTSLGLIKEDITILNKMKEYLCKSQ